MENNFKPEFHLMFLDITKIFDYEELQLDPNYKYPVIDFDNDGTPLITNQYDELITLFPEELQYTILIENKELEGKEELVQNTFDNKNFKIFGDDDRIDYLNKKEAEAAVKIAKEILINRKDLKESLIDRYLEEGEFVEIEKLLKNELF